MKHRTALLVLVPAAVIFISAGIDLANLDNYASQGKPAYINKDNTPAVNPITNKGATLGRVLFYDKKLSANNSIACASCHQQQFAFSDTAQRSLGLYGGFTTRHTPRLVNARFGNEVHFFWDERANSLEDQTSQPLQNAVEMGYAGTNGAPGMDSLIAKISRITYYNTLFAFVFGDTVITETRIQYALAQFVRSIQSFDSKFDAGLAQVNNLNANFPNYTAQENQGKALFLAPPNQGGAGCQGCHRAPEFDIDPNSKNNGVIAVAGNTAAIDLTNTRAPSLRDLFNPSGVLNTRLMHNGTFATFDAVLDHYNLVPHVMANNNLDPRLAGPGGNLQLTQANKNALTAFIKTLSGSNIYTDQKWASPFDANGNLNSTITGIAQLQQGPAYSIYPNPVQNDLNINIGPGNYALRIVAVNGQLVYENELTSSQSFDVSALQPGQYLLEIENRSSGKSSVKKMIRN